MPLKSRWQIDIPAVSLSSYLFTAPSAPLSDKPLLIDAENPDHHLTFHSYRAWSQRLAAGLRRTGFQPGDRLLLFAGNTIFFPVVLQGAVMAGGIFTGANPGFVARELAHQLRDSGAAVMIVAEESVETALEAAAAVGLARERVFVMGSGAEMWGGSEEREGVRGLRHWSELLAGEEEARGFEWEEFTRAEQMERTAVINYSSGTTGVPKGVEITHGNYVANCMQTHFMASLRPDYAAWRARAVALSFLPMYHAYGQTVHAVSLPREHVPVYIMRGRFNLARMLAHVARFRVTALALVPPVAVALTKLRGAEARAAMADLASLEDVGCGAAPLSRETAREFEALVGGRFRLRQGWGMTEITCSACGWDPNVESDAGKVGELNPNVEAMVVDEEGREVAAGERGELLVRGPNVMKGYWRRPEATREALTEHGWLKTGDIAVAHPDGCLSIVDRKKELIKVKGNQVAPAELEGVLLDHPSIQDAAVVGVTISGQERPRAYVVLQQGHDVRPLAIADWIALRVARFKQLTGGVVIVDAVPKNPSGKILRAALRDRARGEVGDVQSRL